MTLTADTPDDQTGVTPDDEAIAAVIHAETLAFQNEDFDAWARCWVHDERTRDVCISNTAGLSVLSGWSEIAEHMQRVFREDLSCKIVDFGQENLKISLSGNTAWVVFDSWSKSGTGESNTCFETRIMEKHNAEWRIAYSSFMLLQTDGANGAVLAVDIDGKVISCTEESRKAVANNPYLMISAGKVRARRRDWDKALQAAVTSAAQHHGFFETHKFANNLGGAPRYPVILGQTDEGGVAVVHFSIRDCITYIRLNDEDLIQQRLNHAQRVFDISNGQIEVAKRIAFGHSLKETASDLGISTNTARTHLARLYDKTGVGTQAALVRLLLSVG